MSTRGEEGAWRRFARSFALAGLLAATAAVGFIAAADPYGLRAAPGRTPGPLMDLNQRYMYPQVVRSGAYDAAVFGTSTARLLDPRDLDAAFGARFANLAMNAATPWEQVQLADLFLRTTRPKALVLSLDSTWCEAGATERRLTFRAFPPWLYGDEPWRGYAHQFNLRSAEIAARVAAHRLFGERVAPARIRGDGYEVFVPPEAAYDAARARAHIHGGRTDDAPPSGSIETPALAWLDDILAKTPREAARIVTFMPVHVAAQGRPGTAPAERDRLCKARAAEIARRHGATTVDFRIPSPITTRDANYWDALHYRLPIGARVVEGLRRAFETGRDDADGFYEVTPPT
jgi:hypothetical protein